YSYSKRKSATQTNNLTLHDALPILKECSKCGENKPLKDYHKSKKSKDGRRTECKKCREVKRTYKPRKDLRGSKFNKLFVLESEQPIRCETHGGYKWV